MCGFSKETSMPKKSSKQAIHKAFVEMIINNKREEINVSSLTKKAHIHRKTFYHHYSCIEELYKEEITNIILAYNIRVENLPIPYTYYDLTKIFFEFYSSNPYYEKLYCDPLYQDIAYQIENSSLHHNRHIYNPYKNYSADMQNIINAFVSRGSSFALRSWIANGKITDINDVICLVSKLLENGVSAIIQKNL